MLSGLVTAGTNWREIIVCAPLAVAVALLLYRETG